MRGGEGGKLSFCKCFCMCLHLCLGVNHTRNAVPEVEAPGPFDALVRNLPGVVNAEGQTDQGETNSNQQKQNHHHMKTTV